MTHTVRFEHVQKDSAGARIAYQQEALEAPTRLDERAILRELGSKGYRGVRCMAITHTQSDPNEMQRDLDRLTRRV
jgi:hypothetical protein